MSLPPSQTKSGPHKHNIPSGNYWEMRDIPKPKSGARYVRKRPGYRGIWWELFEFVTIPIWLPYLFIEWFVTCWRDDLKGHPNPWPYLGDNHRGSPW